MSKKDKDFQDEAVECEETISKLEEENKDLNDKILRNLAEFDNFRKRTNKEKAQMFDNGVLTAMEGLLPVIDNFERALASLEDADESVCKGIELIHRQFIEYLENMGVTRIDCVGEQFDPNIHEAVAHEENNECGENEVMEEIQKGYMYKDKVLRYSVVKVAN